MIQQTNSNAISPQMLYNIDSEIYIYKDSKVKIITVFTDNGKSTALVEDENGELFEVNRGSLR